MSDEGQLALLTLTAIAFICWYLLKKKRTRLTGWDVALKLGLEFKPDITKNIQPQLSFINRLQYGKKHFAFNVFTGTYKGHRVQVFDFIYEVEVMTGKNNSYVKDPYSFFILYLPRKFDEVTIYKEGLLSKLKQLAGGNDIDFESNEFSRKYRVRSKNAKFAYDFCNAKMMNFLLDQKGLSIELDRNILCLSFNRPLEFEEMEQNLLILTRIRNLMPEYLFKD